MVNQILKVNFYNKKPSGVEIAYVVIVSKYEGKWVYVRHKKRSTYEIPGGHIEQGEDYIDAARRELYEETGFDVLPENGKIIFTIQRDDNFCDVWLFHQDFNIENIVFQPNETCGAKWSGKEEIREMINNGEFVPFSYIEKMFKMQY